MSIAGLQRSRMLASCVVLAAMTLISASIAKDAVTEPSSTTADKPGLFRLHQGANRQLCLELGRIINGDIETYGKPRFVDHNDFVKWGEVKDDEIDYGPGGKLDEPVVKAEVDVNNDGVVEKIVRVKWWIGGAPNDVTYILPANQNKIAIPQLVNSEPRVEFNADNYWLKRHVKKYRKVNLDWTFGGVASIELFRMEGRTYVVAENYAAPPGISASIYVFRFDKDYQYHDMCLFRKVCPCGGCTDLHTVERRKTLPAKVWCRK